MSLAEFLLARIAEDEELARRDVDSPRSCCHVSATERLAEAAAKRAIVEHYEDVRASSWNEAIPWSRRRIPGHTGWLYPFDMTPVLKALATVYDTHPGYLQEWKP